MSFARVKLVLAAAVFLAWLGWLAAAVATKGTVQPVSRAQLTAAEVLVVAEVRVAESGQPTPAAKIVKLLRGDAAVGEIEVVNLPSSATPLPVGETRTPAAGQYLLALVKVEPGKYRVAGLPASPGYPATTPERPLIYPWAADVQGQLRKLGLLVE